MAQAVPLPSSEPRTVLLIEDNPGDARLIAEMLREAGGAGFRLECAEGLTDGLERLARSGVDVVLLDLSLPEAQGLDSFLRVRDHGTDVPVVVLTGSDDEELGNRAVQSGAQDYLIKGQVDGPLLGRSLRYAIERGRIEGELRCRAEQLAEMDRRKDEFLATLAHELRNPLAPIRNLLQVLKMPRLDAATIERSRGTMERQVQHLVRLVDDLLDVSRVMRGKVALRKEPVELARVVARAVETAQPLIEAQGHELILDLPSESLLLDADPVRLAQVVGNLLTNAAKYTEPKGRISVTAGREGDRALLCVRDTGIGIAPGMLPKVFELFVQVDHTSTKAQGGLGIGLTLAKNLVEMHGGTVEARSAGLGHGSEFAVRLPLAVVEPKAPSESKTAARPQQAATAHGHRLLVVDDNEDAAESLALLLRLQGHEVRVAHDGPAALAMLNGYQPEMVFLDIGMPGMDGYEVASRLRQRPGLEDLRLAALTGWGQREDRRRTAEAGFDHHLVKPVEPALLEQVLAGLRSGPSGSRRRD
jgi:signal transduction histidine kinase